MLVGYFNVDYEYNPSDVDSIPCLTRRNVPLRAVLNILHGVPASKQSTAKETIQPWNVG
jgi:hypothetical protein